VSGAPTGSALYEGVVWHERRRPFRRSFRSRIWLPLLDLDELPGLLASVPLLDDRPWRPLQFRRSDHHGDPTAPLADAVRDLVAERTGERPDGPIRMLAHLRTWGWCFNPLTLYYCHDRAGSPDGAGPLRWVVAEVTNTPWKERHAYVLPAGPDGVHGHEEPKRLHVSPFWPMEQRYRFELSAPGEQLAVRIENLAPGDTEDAEVVHVAGLALRRRPLTNRALARLLLRHPLLTHRVTAGIHRHAAALAARGARYQPHPRRQTRETVR
jgi:uncharacterized protein